MPKSACFGPISAKNVYFATTTANCTISIFIVVNGIYWLLWLIVGAVVVQGGRDGE
jgi:hypothetical protein